MSIFISLLVKYRSLQWDFTHFPRIQGNTVILSAKEDCEDVCPKFKSSGTMGHRSASLSGAPSPHCKLLGVKPANPVFFAEIVTPLASTLDFTSRTPVHSKLGLNPSSRRCIIHCTIKATKPRCCRAR